MTYFEVLVEGGSDVPALREVLTRRFGLVENEHFRIHPHRGRGRLPHNLEAKPDPKQQGLLDQLPAKLRGFSYQGEETCVLVVVDVDDTPCHQMLSELRTMLDGLSKRPQRVLFRLAIEETESWFIADEAAVRQAYPKAKTGRLKNHAPDAIVGAWEVLAEAVGVKPKEVTGADKYAWAEKIAPHLNLEDPPSPSFRKLIDGINQQLNAGAA
jgi:hypothetical protein